MKLKQLTVLLILSLVLPLFIGSNTTPKTVAAQTTPSLYFGVDVAFESLSLTEQLIDNISSYTNFFIIGCLGPAVQKQPLMYNETRLTIISQYAYDKGLSFIVYTDISTYPSSQWLADAKTKWGDKFLGLYFYDEPGGKQLDQANYPVVTSADNFSDAANQYVSSLYSWLRNSSYAPTNNFAYPNEYKLFTSDYALYWYDYEAGYDTVFAEFGNRIGNWTYSRQLNIALVRGAATVMNKDWGVMITWATNSTPYMESASQLYNDMVLAYQNGAKYILVFDSNENYTQNVLTQDQLNAMKQFWQYTQDNPRNASPVSDRTAYVLPDSFAYAFRGPTEDNIWGLWPTDSSPELYNLTLDISMGVGALLQMDGNNLDMVYPDQLQAIQSAGYGNVVFWNDPGLIQDPPVVPLLPSPASHSYPPLTQHTLPQQPEQDINSAKVNLYSIMAYILVPAMISLIAISFAFLKIKKRAS